MQSQLYVGKVRPLHIDKSQLANYQFKNSEVLSSKEAIRGGHVQTIHIFVFLFFAHEFCVLDAAGSHPEAPRRRKHSTQIYVGF